MASQSTIEIVKSTAPVLKEYGEQITKVFYEKLFETQPGLRNLFNMTNQVKGTQPKVLANAIIQYATYIETPEVLLQAVNSIAHKHSSLSITPEMYPIVGETLLWAIKEVLGDAATPDIIGAWAEAYGELAEIFIAKENSIYREQKNRLNGYNGQKEFKVVRKIEENKHITSFYLSTTDGSGLPEFTPGQYISLTLSIPGTDHLHTRNYSLSDYGNKEALRISVKRESGKYKGLVSNYLHNQVGEGDILSLGMPSGEFYLNSNKGPLVFLAAGVGITPLISMYKSLKGSEREIVFVQCAKNSESHAFRNEIESQKTDNVTCVVIYEEPLPNDIFDYKGYLTSKILSDILPSSPSDVYMCGPKSFMGYALDLLNEQEGKILDVHFEFFGPKEELESQINNLPVN